MHTLFVGDFDARVSPDRRGGLEAAEREAYVNGVRKATFRDPDGNEIGYGSNPVRPRRTIFVGGGSLRPTVPGGY
jgi:hypothetical protein